MQTTNLGILQLLAFVHFMHLCVCVQIQLSLLEVGLEKVVTTNDTLINTSVCNGSIN